MDNVREKLMSLLVLCSDNDTEATKLQFLASITQSDDYDTLRNSVALKKPFERLYTQSRLEELSNVELKSRKSLLHSLASFNKLLVHSIHYGNGPELSNADMPDFTSLSSIEKCSDTIHLLNEKTNYTNITEENALDIFLDSTIKSALECFKMLPVATAKSDYIDEATIKQYMKNTLFCINIDEFVSCHQSFLDFAEKNESIIEKEKVRRRRHRLFKVAIIMLCFGAIYSCDQFGLLSSTFTPILTFVMLIVSVIFFILG